MILGIIMLLRGFADELIPHEEYAEAHDGELPADVAHRLELERMDVRFSHYRVDSDISRWIAGEDVADAAVADIELDEDVDDHRGAAAGSARR